MLLGRFDREAAAQLLVIVAVEGRPAQIRLIEQRSGQFVVVIARRVAGCLVVAAAREKPDAIAREGPTETAADVVEPPQIAGACRATGTQVGRDVVALQATIA